MKLTVLLEGAETKEQMDYAYKIGIEEIQGYFVSKPLFIENLAKKFINKKSDF
jgi:EAL domain-containing protein (putative c-di-GMP-specific phosphodiesterase class I)